MPYYYGLYADKLCSTATNWASPECLLVFFNMKNKPKTLLPVQLRRSWSAWTQRGLWCVGRAWACQTWTVTKSLGGSAIAAWQESWSSPAYRRRERRPRASALVCSAEGLWNCDGTVGDTACWWDRNATLLVDCAESRDLGEKTATTRDWKQSQMERNAKREELEGGRS